MMYKDSRHAIGKFIGILFYEYITIVGMVTKMQEF